MLYPKHQVILQSSLDRAIRERLSFEYNLINYL